MELIPTPTPEIYAALLSALEIDEESLKNAAKELELWLENQPHLPHDFDEKILSLFYLRNKKRMKETKANLETYYTMRCKYPELLCERDPCQPWFTQTSDIVFFCPLPELTEDHCRVEITGNLHSDISNYNVYDICKMDIMVQELRLLGEFTPLDIIIIDCINTNIYHYTKYTLPFIFKMKTIILEGFRTRLKSLHYINAPIYLQISLKLLKLVLKPKLFKRIHVHSGLGNLHEFVPLRILPNEYGGEAGSVYDIWDAWKQKIVSQREWFLRQENLKCDESKRS